MSIKSFAHLLDILAPRLEVDERQSSNSSGEEPISPCIMLMATLRYLSGGSYLDIHRTVDSDSEKEVVMADFRAISSGGVMNGCVGCVDGWLCRIKSPSARDAGDVGTGKYFSGHYCCPGINVQGECDAHCRFPGSTNDA
ncbi:hypothetical protein JG687_00015834 [Phytophthora cactorum]|uniref:Uncharacterized protein n=1 Tax=Phytophthora cactorum TaxID=29920 RepID=A0A8T1TV81_9STRA|nr:hypothetical protein JG687_00015834 [Phytophthora cactorum]